MNNDFNYLLSDISLGRVSQNGFLLGWVKNQTQDICLTAVSQDGRALRYVREQTPEICLAAVKKLEWQYIL